MVKEALLPAHAAAVALSIAGGGVEAPVFTFVQVSFYMSFGNFCRAL